jgi:hypothetical protein
MDYQEINKLTPPLPAAMSSANNILDQLTLQLGQYNYVVDLTNAFFSIDLEPKSEDQFIFT